MEVLFVTESEREDDISFQLPLILIASLRIAQHVIEVYAAAVGRACHRCANGRCF